MSMNLGMTSQVEFNRALLMLEDITNATKPAGKGTDTVGLLNGHVVTKASDKADPALCAQLTRIAQALADNVWPEQGAETERLRNEKNRETFMTDVRKLLGLPNQAGNEKNLPRIRLSQLRAFADKMTEALESNGLATKHADSFEDGLGFTEADIESAKLDAEFKGLINSAKTLKNERKEAAAQLWNLELALSRETGKTIPADLKLKLLQRITNADTTKEMLEIMTDGFKTGNIDPYAVGDGPRHIEMPEEMKARFLYQLNTNNGGHPKELNEAIARTITDLPRGWNITFEGEKLPVVSTDINERKAASEQLLKIINKVFREGEDDFKLQFLQMCASQYVDGMIFGMDDLMMGKLPGGVAPSCNKIEQRSIDVRRVDDNTLKVHYHLHLGNIMSVVSRKGTLDPSGNPPIPLKDPEGSYLDKDYVITWRRNTDGEWIADMDDGMTVDYNFSEAATKKELLSNTAKAFNGYIENDLDQVIESTNKSLEGRSTINQTAAKFDPALLENAEFRKIFMEETVKTVAGRTWDKAGDYSIDGLGYVLGSAVLRYNAEHGIA